LGSAAVTTRVKIGIWLTFLAATGVIYWLYATGPAQVSLQTKKPVAKPKAVGFPNIPTQAPDRKPVVQRQVTDEEQCADCHPEEVEAFHKTGMGRSLYPTKGAKQIEKFEKTAATVVHEPTGFAYRAYIDSEGRWWQEESLAGTDYRKAVEAKYIIGSGNHTRSYLGHREGELVELPLTWYVQRGIWDMSPGYQGNNFRFARPIPPKCLFCHNNLTPIRSDAQAGYFEPLASGISCNRCHGDGKKHVEKRLKGEPFDNKDSQEILNPRDLTGERQTQLCGQCHLQGLARILEPGRRWDEYDPRTPLPDYMNIFVLMGDSGPDFGIASHGARLKKSKCAQEGGATCSHCHNPHKADKTASHRQACLTCHEKGTHCPKPDSKQGDCAKCHMNLGKTSDIPHVNFTDHFIRIPPFEKGPKKKPGTELVAAFSSKKSASRTEVALALAHYEAWRQGSDDNPKAHLKHARKRLEELIKSGVQDPRILMAHGRLQYAKKKSSKAIESLSRAAAELPEDYILLTDLALAQQQGGQLDEARDTLLKALKLRPNGRAAWVNLGSVLTEMNQNEQADAAYARADKINPHFALTAINRGRNASRRGRKAEARKWFRLATKRDPRAMLGYLHLALMETDDRRFSAARKAIRQALAVEKDFPAAYWLRGRIELEERDPKAAEQSFRKFLALKPNDLSAYLELSVVLAKTKRVRAAIALLQEAKAKIGNHPHLNRALRRLHNQPKIVEMPDMGFTIE